MNRKDLVADVAFSRQAWTDYQDWLRTDRKIAARIARLIEECLRDPFRGIGSPEPLRHELGGYRSRRITKEHRLVYKIEEGLCVVVQCRYHY